VRFLIAQVLPYITVTIFTLGVLYRLGRWAGARRVHNINLSPWVPDSGQMTVRIGTEAFLFRSLWIFDKGLWVGAIAMHLALLNIIGGHIVGFGFLGEQFAYIPGITVEMSKAASDMLGKIFGIILFVALAYLLLRRLTIPAVKQVNRTSDIFWLVFLLALVGIGNLMRFVYEFYMPYEHIYAYMAHLFTFQSVMGLPALDNYFFLAHFLLVQIMLILLPFSKLLHLFGMFGMRWLLHQPYQDPAPGLPNVDVQAARRAGLGVPAGDSSGGV